MPILTPTTTQNLPKSVDPAVRKSWVDGYKKVDPRVEAFFEVMTQEDYNEQHQNYTGLGEVPIVGEGQNYTTDSAQQSFGTTYTPTKYGVLVTVTDEEMRYDKSGVAKASTNAKAEGKAIARKVSKVAASVYNNSTNVAFTSLGDDKPLGSIQHDRIDAGAAQSNASATGAALTEANLETGMLAGEQVLDDRGQIITIFMDELIVPPSLRKTALIITKSEKRSGTGDNDLNVYNVAEFEGLHVSTVKVWKFLSLVAGGSDTRWFLKSSDDFRVNWLWGVKPEIAKYDESLGFANDTHNWKSRFEASTGWDDWRGFYVSNGDGQAYAN